MSVFYLVKDYIEVVHKLIETSPNYVLQQTSYTDFLTIINFSLTTLKQFCSNILSFQWLNQLWYFPIIIPEIATSMMEEISVLDGNFHNILTFLDKPIAMGNEIYGSYYLPVTLIEKFFTGLVNSLFIWLPTSTATFLCFRRFIMQGVEAGYAAALGTMSASLFWFGSILFGLRFIVVPWMSLDLFRYWLGFLLLMKYFWDNRYAYKEVKHNDLFGKNTKRNIFGFHFLLALTEQSSLYPFLNNFSISSQSTMLESFPSENFFDFSLVHFSYLLGIAIGSYSLINFICWFWQDPAYRFYFWIMNKFKKLRIADIVRPVHLFFQTITVLFAFSSLPYFGIEYQIANPLGFLPNDQVFHQFKQTSFLTHSTSPAYYRSRLNFPRQKFFRYEDWAEYYHRNTPIDTSLYDQGAYRLYTMEDLSYGKDYEWMRRRSDKIKIRSRLKRLRWFPRNWANRLWEFTKTWSRRNVFWRNDILNMYQYSWDSKAPIIWGKLVFEDFFPTKLNPDARRRRNPSDQKVSSVQLNLDAKRDSNPSLPKPLMNEDTKTPVNNINFSPSMQKINRAWDSFWGPDPDWSSKFLWNETTLQHEKKDFWWNWQSKLNLSDNDIWWKWLITQYSSVDTAKVKFSERERTLKSDFWEPQKRFISLYSDQYNRKESILEYSILRKFVRKLTARFKLSQIDSQNSPKEKERFILNFKNFDPKDSDAPWHREFSSTKMKTLLLLPSLRDWTVFQTVMTNINQMLWWRCLLFGESKKKTSFNFSKYNSLLELKTDLNYMTQKQYVSKRKAQKLFFTMGTFFQKTKIGTENSSLKYKNNNSKNQTSDLFRGSYASKLKFEKLQKKYFQIQLTQNTLNSNLSTSKISQIGYPEQLNPDARRRRNPPDQKVLKLQSSLKLTGESSLKTLIGSNSAKQQVLMSPTFSSEKFQNPVQTYNFPFDKKLGQSSLWSLPFSSTIGGGTLVHPIKYYLHKEETFKKKLNFYGVKKTGNLIVNKLPEKNMNQKEKQLMFLKGGRGPINLGYDSANNFFEKRDTLRTKNNLPIFNFYLKTYFQTYKKTKLYVLNTKMKRQLGMGASARRKGRDYSNKLLKRSKILANTPWIRQWIDQSGFLARRKRLETWIARQHYDPNELWSKIMKIDVDLFMNRQPNSYFLTNTEEKLLHLRRFLLFEHYDSLRWYTFMTNYRTMKNTIGGTKSFTNKLYNQQFKGTFHKVRHLFSLTPSVSNGTLLKFDQSLYNLTTNFQIGHEEVENGSLKDSLLEDKNIEKNKSFEGLSLSQNLDIIEKSTQMVKQSIWQNNLIRKKYIEESLQEKNSNLLTQSLIQNSLTPGSEGFQRLGDRNPFESLPGSGSLSNSQKSVSNFTTGLQQTQSIKTNLQNKLMISLFKNKQKWTKDYKRSSEKLWKKWKFHNILLSNASLNKNSSFGLVPENSGGPREKKIFVFSKFLQEKELSSQELNSVSPDLNTQKQLFINTKTENSSDLKDSQVNLKFVQISKLKKARYKNETSNSLQPVEKLTDTIFENQNLISSVKFNQKQPQESVMNSALRDGIKIQSFTNQLPSNTYLTNSANDSDVRKNQILSNSSNPLKGSQKNLFQNNFFTRKLIKERYMKILERFNKTKNFNNKERFNVGSLLTSESSSVAELVSSFVNKIQRYSFFMRTKLSLDYKLKNILNKPIENPTKERIEREISDYFISENKKFFEQQHNNLQKELNVKLYQKNFLRRERSNIQNLIFMKKFLLNDSNSSLTRSQIRPLPGKRTKSLYERGARGPEDQKSGELSYYNQNLTKIENKLQPTFIFSSEAGSNIDLKIRAYKNYKWFEEADKSNKKIASPEPSFKLVELNQYWKTVIKKLKNTKLLVSDQMDETLQKKFLKFQNHNFLINSLNRQNISSLKDNSTNPKNLIWNPTEGRIKTNLSEFVVSSQPYQKQSLQNNVRQKLTKTILKRALQKVSNSSGNKNLFESDMPNVIRLTKSLRKRQQDKIVRSLLKRHLNLKSRRKLFLKTKELNNQRMVLDRNFEIQERLFINKISYYDQFQKNLDLQKKEYSLKETETDFSLYYTGTQAKLFDKKNNGEERELSLTKSFGQSNDYGSSFNNIQKSTSNLFTNLIDWLNQSLSTNTTIKEIPTGESILEKKKNSEIFSEKSNPSFKTKKATLFFNRAYPLKTWEKFAAVASTNSFVLENTKRKKEIITNLQKKKLPFIFSEGLVKKSRRQWALESFGSKTKNKNIQVESYLSSLTRSTNFINHILENKKIRQIPDAMGRRNALDQKNLFTNTNSFFVPEKSGKFLSLKLKQKLKDADFYFGNRNNNNGDTLSLEPEKNVLRRSLRKFFVSDYRFVKKHSRNFKTLLKNNFHNYSQNPDIRRDSTGRFKNLFINNLLLKNWIKEKSKTGFKENKKIVYPFQITNQQNSTKQNVVTNYDLKTGTQKLPLNGLYKNELINLNKYIISSRTNPNKLSKQQMRKKLKKRRIIRLKRMERLKTLKDHPLKFRSEQTIAFYNVKDSLAKWKNFSFIAQKSNYNNLALERLNNSFSPVKFFSTNGTKVGDSLNLVEQTKLNNTKNLVLKNSLSLTPLTQISNSLSGSQNSKVEPPVDTSENTSLSNSDIFYTLYKNIFLDDSSLNSVFLQNNNNNANLETIKSSLTLKPLESSFLTNMPFYAGWDESVRKFVLTNRLLSRREAGYEIAKNSVYPVEEKVLTTLNQNIIFDSWPLKGKNAATTLFSQFPFMTAPQNNLNFSANQTLVLKGGTKYELQDGTTISNTGFLGSKFMNLDSSTNLQNKLIELKWSKKSNEHLIEERINFKKKKRIKTIIKSSKNEDHVGIRQAGQVISNLATVKNRQEARRNLFSSISWRTNKQTTKSFLEPIRVNKKLSSSNSKLFVFSNSKNNLIDKKLSAKLLLLRNLRSGNSSQTKLTYLRRLQTFIRPTGSAWKKNITLSRRKKQNIQMDKNVLSSGFIDYFPNRFNVRKRKKRSNNKNPRLRGDKNFKKTKRQYRQKAYLRPKNRPLRRRSLGVLFQNKLNYWRLNYQNLSTNTQKGLYQKEDMEGKMFTQPFSSERVSQSSFENVPFHQKSPSFSVKKDILQTSKNLKENSLYSINENEWEVLNRPKKLYRSLFSNTTTSNPLLYETLPGHNRSIPIIKNLPLPGSSVKTLNRIVKWSSADGAARFYRVNLSYGWALELFLKDLQQKIRLKVNPSFDVRKDTLSMNSIINDYLFQLTKTNKNKFSATRLFKRKSYKLRQLSYTMSMRLYDRWFFYYYKTLNDSLSNKEQTNLFSSLINQKSLNIENIERNNSTVSLFKHIKKLLTFHLTDSQITFRSYLKNLRNTAYLKNQNLAVENNKFENLPYTGSALQSDAFSSEFSKKNTGLDKFQLFKKKVKQINVNPSDLVNEEGFIQNTENEQSNVPLTKSVAFGEAKRNKITNSRSLLKKEKKYAEDRFFFAQFNKPPLVDEYRLTLENNRHYPVNGGFVWPGDYLRLKTILLPKEIKDFYLREKNKKTMKITKLNKINSRPLQLHFKGRLS